MNLPAEIKFFVQQHETDNVQTLLLQAKRYPHIDMQLAIQQIQGKQKSKEKIPAWHAQEDIRYSKHISLEQCSSQATALYKATLCRGNTMVDLTGGLGVDFSFIAPHFQQSTYVEQQAELVELATHNMKVLSLTNVEFVHTEAVLYLEAMPLCVDLIYIDPARRSLQGAKTTFIEDCSPNIIAIQSLLDAKAKQAIIKLSPMLDISLAIASIQKVSDVHIVSCANECKELLFVRKREMQEKIYLHCINILANRIEQFVFTKEDEEQLKITYTSHLCNYLYEPNSSILKAGAYKSIAKEYTLHKLHVSSHLYTSNELYPLFQGRKFIIERVCSLNKKDIKQYLTGIKQANITTRNFPLDVQGIRKRTGLKDGGDMYIFATTLADEKKVLILCRKVQ